MERLRDQLLAGSGLTADEHRHVEVGDALDVGAHAFDRIGIADEPEVRRARRISGRVVEYQDHAIGELEHHSSLERTLIDLFLPRASRRTGCERTSVEDRSTIRDRFERDAVGEPRDLHDRAATEVAVGERTRLSSARWLEHRRGSRNLQRLAHADALADARDIRVIRDRQRDGHVRTQPAALRRRHQRAGVIPGHDRSLSDVCADTDELGERLVVDEPARELILDDERDAQEL